MAEPKWMADLDLASYRTQKPAVLASIWVRWLISQLHPNARIIAARAWKNGKTPEDVIDQLRPFMPSKEMP